MAIQTGSLTAYPQAVDDTYSNYPELINPINPVGKGARNTTYAHWYSGYQSSRWTYWPFDLSAIPGNAVIDSVKCLGKAGYYSASNVNIATLQLYCGDTAKGTVTSFAGKTGQALSVDGGSWTREELKTCGLRVLGNSVGSNATYRRFYFYGADLTVEYTVNTQKFMLKLEGAYADIPRVFQKLSGVWIEQDDLNDVVVSENGLVNGGEYVAPKLINFTIGGTSYQAEEGMTWAEWLSSSYNTDKFIYTYGGYADKHIMDSTLDHMVADNTYTYTYVSPDWFIVENHPYMLIGA